MLRQKFTRGAIIAAALAGSTAAHASSLPNAYQVNNAVSDLPNRAAVQDPNLKNSWGLTFTSAASAFWIADNNDGLATLYDGNGTIVPLVVTIPCPPQAGVGSACPQHAAPTGTVANPTTAVSTAFLVPGTKLPAAFIFVTEDGTISAWAGGLTPPDNAVLAVNNAVTPNPTLGAVYKGLAVGVNVNGVFLFATNFRAGTVEVYAPAPTDSPNGQYVQVKTDGGFVDPEMPDGFAPFGIQNVDGDLFVTYAQQNAAKTVELTGAGLGFVDEFDTDGHLLKRFATGGKLNGPWAVARASSAFGRFSGDILVGNNGDGKINVFDSNGKFLDQLMGPTGEPITISGLWALSLGGGAKSSSDTLFFTAGPGGYADGLFGTIVPASDTN
jgi:uncharacterized protein (TIGR03118 family)